MGHRLQLQTTAPGSSDGSRRARFYTFTLAESAEVTIVLESGDADTFLYLREGEAKTGTELHLNDDDGSTSRSRIQEILAAGDYTIEATTYSDGETGSFTLTVSGLWGPGARGSRILVDTPSLGHFHHDTGRFTSGAVYHPLVDTAAAIYDVAAGARFENPHGADEGSFSYGFVLRGNADGPDIFFMVYSDRQWGMTIGIDDAIEHEGAAPGLQTAKYDKNYLSISVVGKWAAMWLNGSGSQTISATTCSMSVRRPVAAVST